MAGSSIGRALLVVGLGLVAEACRDAPAPSEVVRTESLLYRGSMVQHVVVGSQYLFFTDQEGDEPVKRMPLGGGAAVPLAQLMGNVVGVAPAGGDLLYVEERSGMSPSGYCAGWGAVGVLSKVSFATRESTPLAQASACQGLLGPLVVGSSAYWVTSLDYPGFQLVEQPLDRGPERLLATTSEPVWAIAGDGEAIYWVEQGSGAAGSVKRVPIAGGPVETLYAAPLDSSLARVLAAGGGQVYFAEDLPAGTRLVAVPSAGGTPALVDPVNPRALAADASGVAWLDPTRLRAAPGHGSPAVTLVDFVPLSTTVAVANGVVLYDDCDAGCALNRVPLAGGAPQRIASSLDRAVAIAASDPWVFWADGNSFSPSPSVARLAVAPLAGGTASTLLTWVGDGYSPIATDGSHVYVADGVTVKRVPAGGGALDLLYAGRDRVVSVVAGGGSVYFQDQQGSVFGLPASGGAATMIHAGIGLGRGPVRVSNGDVYWHKLAFLCATWPCEAWSIWKAPGGGPSTVELASNLPEIQDLAVAAGQVFFAERATGQVKRVPATGGIPVPLADLGTVSAVRLAAADGWLYWITAAAIEKVAALGGEAERLRTPGGATCDLALDPNGLVWSDAATAEIRRLTPR